MWHARNGVLGRRLGFRETVQKGVVEQMCGGSSANGRCGQGVGSVSGDGHLSAGWRVGLGSVLEAEIVQGANKMVIGADGAFVRLDALGRGVVVDGGCPGARKEAAERSVGAGGWDRRWQSEGARARAVGGVGRGGGDLGFDAGSGGRGLACKVMLVVVRLHSEAVGAGGEGEGAR